MNLILFADMQESGKKVPYMVDRLYLDSRIRGSQLEPHSVRGHHVDLFLPNAVCSPLRYICRPVLVMGMYGPTIRPTTRPVAAFGQGHSV